MQARHVRRNRRTQLGNAEILSVERLARGERGDGGIANIQRCYFVGLAEPESEDRRVAEALVGDFADLRGNQRAHRAARRKIVGVGNAAHREFVAASTLYCEARPGARAMKVYGILNCNTVKAAR